MNQRSAEMLAKAKARLEEFLREGKISNRTFDAMQNYVLEAFRVGFGTQSREYGRISEALNPGASFYSGSSQKDYIDAAQDALVIIASIEEIHTEILRYDPDLTKGVERVAHASSKKVFLVHGRDEALRERAARFLERAGLEPIILSEQPGGGATIIEKLENNSDVAFAVVLLTPDDQGGLQGDDMKPRARQNVIFELGYFVGLLARKRVCALVEPSVEIFSDIDGVNYITVEGNSWKAGLAKELKYAGFDVDLEALL